jgi:hypothetical protein
VPSPSPTSTALRAFAEDPPSYGEIDPRSGLERVLTDRYCLLLGPSSALVSRLRLDPDGIPEAVHEIREQIARRGLRRVEWRVGGSATPADLADRLITHGFVPAPDPHMASMLVTTEPPAVDGVEARRVRDLEEYALATRISADAFGEEHVEATEEDFAGERSGAAPRVYVALVDGRAVGAARALFDASCPAVMLISGGVVADARGRGAYRALVRARWDDAVAAGTPALNVLAGSMSRPILERLGFETVAEHDVLIDPTTC